jgi:catechol-2,3-dioxygenase
MSQPPAEPTPLDSETVLRPVFHHVNVRTKEVDAIIEWYGTVAGLQPNFRAERFAFLSNDAANHRIAVVGLPADAPESDVATRVGIHHLAFEYDRLDGLLATYVRLKRAGILPAYCLDHGLTISFYYRDPDGNFVELQADAYGDWARSTEFLRSDPRFVADPIGPAVDPDAMIEARGQGATAQELHERAYRGEFAPTNR